jgi:hexokinase
MDPSDRARGFLHANGMFHGDIDALRCTEEFREEMEAGLSGRPSSLRMIPTFIEADREIPVGEPVIAMDAGGTNLRIALVEFDAEGDPRISAFERHRMPGLDGEIPAETFFDVLAGHVRRLAPRSGRVGLSFSYPAEILPTRDGRIVALSKELRVAGVVGQLVGERLNAALRSSGARGDLKFVVLNDTVGALLAGRAAHGARRYSRYVGFVLGTGLNCAYVEANDRVRKRGDLPPGGRQIINVESGAYGRVPRGAIDLALDAASAEPGTYLLEKSVSGAYLGALCLQAFQAAAEEGLFSDGACECLRTWPRLETPELEPFLGGEAGAALHTGLRRSGSAADLSTASALVDLLIERAAKLCAVNMSAALLHGVSTGPADAPACITVDGSTFYRLRGYRERIIRWVDQILGGRLQYEVTSVESAALIGAAVGGITN